MTTCEQGPMDGPHGTTIYMTTCEQGPMDGPMDIYDVGNLTKNS